MIESPKDERTELEELRQRSRSIMRAINPPADRPIPDSELDSVIDLGSPFMQRMAKELRFWKEQYKNKCEEANELLCMVDKDTVIRAETHVKKEGSK